MGKGGKERLTDPGAGGNTAQHDDDAPIFEFDSSRAPQPFLEPEVLARAKMAAEAARLQDSNRPVEAQDAEGEKNWHESAQEKEYGSLAIRDRGKARPISKK
jgi:hypothetical protein